MSELHIGKIVSVDPASVRILLDVKDLNVEHGGKSYRVGTLGSFFKVPANGTYLIGFVTNLKEVDTGDDCSWQMGGQLLGIIADGKFSRGVNEQPVIGDEVELAVQADFDTIFGDDGSPDDEAFRKYFRLGRFAMDANYDVKVIGKEFFAKHVALVGNSGSGKSCTTAKILQEVLELPQSQVVLFDMHGEYRAAFSDDNGRLNPNVTYLGQEDLVLPYWLLTYAELEDLLVDASDPRNVSSQVSFLRTALMQLRDHAAQELGLAKELTLDTPVYFSLEQLLTYAQNMNEARYVLNSDRLALAKLAERSMPPEEQEELVRTRRCLFNKGNPEGETPHPLYFANLLGLIDRIETRSADRRYEFLLRPIQHARQSSVFAGSLDDTMSPGRLSKAMNDLLDLLTGRTEPRKNLTIVDLSGIPFDVVDVTVAVITRLLFDFNFWTPASQRHPILLVFEEAHNYIPRAEGKQSFARRVVEKVAKEGRKYGVSAMVVSQRPCELSETVLSQCNSMIVMRLNNPDDQAYIARVVSDQFTSLIQSLPTLRPGEGFVLGDAVIMPLRTRIDPPRQLPRSGDADFFKHWSADRPDNKTDDVIQIWWRQDRKLLNAEQNAAATSPDQPTGAESPSNRAVPMRTIVAPS